MIPRLTVFVSLAVATAAVAHEGHAALPTRGASVNVEKGTIVLSRESRDALGVETAEIGITPLPESTSAYFTFVSPWTKHAFASSRLAGRIVALKAAPGDVVQPGQPLAEVESMELENLQEEILQARTERRVAEELVKLLRASAGAVSGQALIEAETTVEQQQNAESVGRLKWRSLGLGDEALESFLADSAKRIKRLEVSSPIGGRVVHADIALGKVVEPGEHLFEVVDLSVVWVKIGVLERDLGRVRLGASARLHATARSSEIVEARIDATNPALDGPNLTATAWATLANPPSAEPIWLPGMTGKALVFAAPRGDAKVVPTSALIDDGVAQYVLVEEAAAQKQSEYRRKEVEVVRRTPKLVEVRSAGLFPGDRVVVKGAQQLGGFFVPGVLKLTREAAASIGLEVARVERRSIGRVAELDGIVDLPPESKAAASARLGGNILRLHVDRGQQVKRGDLLAEVQSNELQSLQLDFLKEDLNFAVADRRLKALKSAGDSVSRRRLLDVEAASLTARNRRETLRRRLQMIGVAGPRIDELASTRRLVDAVPVVAPIDGVVAGFDKALGQVVRADEPLFTVYDSSRALIKGFAADRDSSQLSVGLPARVRLASDPLRPMSGKVVRSSGVFSAEDQALAFWIELDSAPKAFLRQGQLARITLVVDDAAAPAAVVVPNSALVREGNRRFAFVQKPDGVFERRGVDVGRSDDQFVEILAGLRDGEAVAMRGAAGLQTAHASVR